MCALGVNAAFHDCSACVVSDGVVLAAAEEKRFTRVKHGKRPVPFTVWQLPYHAIEYCLKEADIALRDVDHVAYSYEPWLQLNGNAVDSTLSLLLEPSKHGGPVPWDALSLSYIVNAPR